MKNKNPKTPLHKDFKNHIERHLAKDEEILWIGIPKQNFSVTILEVDDDYDGLTSLKGLFGITLLGIGYFCVSFYNSDNWIGLFLTIILGLVIIAIPDIIKNIRKKNTKYAFSKTKVFFQLWRWGRISFQVIDLAQVGKITYEEFDNKSGVIHFLPREPFDFYTYDFIAGGRRFYPTFELVSDVIELQKRLDTLRKEYL